MSLSYHLALVLSLLKIDFHSLHISLSIFSLSFSASHSPLSHLIAFPSHVPLLFPFSHLLSVFDFPFPWCPLSFYHFICCIFHSSPPSFLPFFFLSLLPSCLLPLLLFPLPNCCISYSWSLTLPLIATCTPPLSFSCTEK